MGVRFEASPSCHQARSSGFSATVSLVPADGRLLAATYEVDADGGDVGLGVGVVGEPQQQARLADTGVADEQQLEEVVVSGILSAAVVGDACKSAGVAELGSWAESGAGKTLRKTQSVSSSKQR